MGSEYWKLADDKIFLLPLFNTFPPFSPKTQQKSRLCVRMYTYM